MDNFNYCNPARIVFGKGVASQLGSLVKSYGGTKVLLHYGGGSVKRNGALDDAIASLNEANIPYVELGGVRPNPDLALVKKGIATVKAENIDFVIAVGGGSTIDSAKAIAVGAAVDFDFWEELFMKGKPAPKSLPLGVVLTLAATGSESSTSCVISNYETGYKRGIGGEALIPKFSLLDPSYTFSLPTEQTAYGSCDILAHLMERYFTPTRDVTFTDNMIEAAMKTVIEFAPVALENPRDYNARAQLMWVGTIAHNNLLNTGRLGDWASHKIEHELSARYGIYHGEGLAVVFPAWMKYVCGADKARFERFAENVWGCTGDGKVEKGIAALENWLRSLGLKTRLSELGIGTEYFEDMAQKCLYLRGHVGEFVQLGEKDVVEIYKLAL